MDILSAIEKLTRHRVLFIATALILLIGIVDFLTGYELNFSVIYVLPIALVSWFMSQRAGLLASLVSTAVWSIADLGTGHSYTHPLIPVWNGLIRLAFFVIISWLLSTLRRVTEHERELARIDYLTGAANARCFYDFLEMEIHRFHRFDHPFTLAYIDLDNFKAVNDQLGHSTGDQVLCAVVSSAKRGLRRTDTIARLGGDEFAVLLPETDEKAARVVLSKIQESLLTEMQQSKWPVTLSMGAMTCAGVAPQTADELVKRADDLMYEVKREGKNSVKYATYAA